MTLKELEKSIKKDDPEIILHEPLEVIKYGRKFVFKPILWRDWEKYSYYMGLFINYYHTVCGFSMLPDNLNELEEFAKNIKTTLVKGRTAFKWFAKMMKLSRMDLRFMKKNFNMSDMAEFMVLSYLVNIKVVKKNFKIAYDLLMAT
jgi:hypothetical protein